LVSDIDAYFSPWGFVLTVSELLSALDSAVICCDIASFEPDQGVFGAANCGLAQSLDYRAVWQRCLSGRQMASAQYHGSPPQ
jgi:hypothetical protein